MPVMSNFRAMCTSVRRLSKFGYLRRQPAVRNEVYSIFSFWICQYTYGHIFNPVIPPTR